VKEDWNCEQEATLLRVIDTDVQDAYCMTDTVRRIIKERDEARRVARDLWWNHIRERFYRTSVEQWEAEHPWLKEFEGGE
jgi:hypothetical protein